MVDLVLKDFENKILLEKKLYFNEKSYSNEILLDMILRAFSKYNRFLMDIKKYIHKKNKSIQDINNKLREKNKVIIELSDEIQKLKLLEETFIHEVENYSFKIENYNRKIKENENKYDQNYLYLLYFYFISCYFIYLCGCNGFYNVLYSTYYIFIVNPIYIINDIITIIFDGLIINSIFS